MIRIIVVDNDAFVVTGIEAMLAEEPEIAIVATAHDGASAVECARTTEADVILMDIRMPGTDGITATHRITQLPNPPRILALTTWDTDNFIRDMLAAGAAGFLLKDASPDELAESIKRAHRGLTVLAPAITDHVVAAFTHDTHERRRAVDALECLSDLETVVATAIADGLTNAEISEQHYMSVGNVKACVSRILTKLDLSNRVQIATLVRKTQ